MSASRLRRWAAVLGFAVAIGATASIAHAAEKTAAPIEQLTVQDIETLAYPKVSLKVTIPRRPSSAGEPTFVLRENGKKVSADAVKLDVRAQETKVVLMLDTSGSMSGETWSDVKRAASTFLSGLPAGAPVSVIAFDESKRTLVDFTTDRALLISAIEGLQPARETALYDTVLSASRALSRQGDGRKAIVLFSDGGDTISASSFNGAMQSLLRTKIPLYSVMLHSPEENPQALRLLATRSGGRFLPADRSAELPAVFETIANEIIGAYTIDYTSLEPDTKDIEVDIDAKATARSARARIAYPNPAYAVRTAPKEFVKPTVIERVRMLAGAGVLVLISATALAFAIIASLFRERTMLSHMHIYDQRQRRRRWQGIDYLTGLPARLVQVMERFLSKRGYTERLTPLFEAAGLPKQIAYYATTYVVVALAAVLLVQTFLEALPLTLVAAAVAAWAPKGLLTFLADRRKHEIEDQLVEVLQQLATSLRGGWTLERALELTAAEAPQPTGREFARVIAEIKLGMPAHSALEQMSQRLKSPDFETFVSGVTMQREVGGNLAEVIDAVTDTVRERDQLRRHMRTLTAEAKFSAYILVALPFVLALMMFTTSRSYFDTLLRTPSGLAILALTAVLVAGGAVWVFRLAKIEV